MQSFLVSPPPVVFSLKFQFSRNFCYCLPANACNQNLRVLKHRWYKNFNCYNSHWNENAVRLVKKSVRFCHVSQNHQAKQRHAHHLGFVGLTISTTEAVKKFAGLGKIVSGERIGKWTSNPRFCRIVHNSHKMIVER